MSRLIGEKLDAVRTRLALVSAGCGASMALGAFVAALGVSMLLDFWLDLGWWSRAALLAANLATVAAIGARHIAIPLLFGPDDDELALMVERENAVFRNRLIAAVQLTRPGAVPAGASRSLVEAMVMEAEGIARPLNFNAVVRSEPLLKRLAGALVVAAVFACGYAWGGEPSRDLLLRAFLTPGVEVPRKTRGTLVAERLRVPRGESAEIRVKARGVIPAAGRPEGGSRSVARGMRDWSSTSAKASEAFPQRQPEEHLPARLAATRP